MLSVGWATMVIPGSTPSARGGPRRAHRGEGKDVRMRSRHDDREPTADRAGSAWEGRDPAAPLSKNAHLLRWVEKMARLTLPAAVHWVDGTRGEYDALCAQMVKGGTLIKLN